MPACSPWNLLLPRTCLPLVDREGNEDERSRSIASVPRGTATPLRFRTGNRGFPANSRLSRSMLDCRSRGSVFSPVAFVCLE